MGNSSGILNQALVGSSRDSKVWITFW